MQKNNISLDLLPDIVISMGNNVSSYNIKSFLRDNHACIEHWEIDECGRIRDTYMCLTSVFECSIEGLDLHDAELFAEVNEIRYRIQENQTLCFPVGKEGILSVRLICESGEVSFQSVRFQ